jgi:uncharacterized protein DUF1207
MNCFNPTRAETARIRQITQQLRQINQQLRQIMEQLRPTSVWRLAVALGALAWGLLLPSAAQAQDRWFPDEVFFQRPTAAPREPTFALRGVWTNLFERRGAPSERSPFTIDEDAADLRTDAQGEAALGGTVRLWRAASWEDGGISLGIASAVFGRFRLEVSSSDLVASDWIVALPLEVRRGAWSGRVQIMHWSAHLGDEMIEKSGIERIDFTHNAVSLLLARDLGGVRVYGGGSRISKSSLENEEQLPSGFSDNSTVQFGADATWTPWQSALQFEAGVDYQAADRTDWAAQWSLVGGIRVQDGTHTLQLHATYFDGPSPVGQFFLTQERAWGFSLVLEL